MAIADVQIRFDAGIGARPNAFRELCDVSEDFNARISHVIFPGRAL
jgi:hypothetical protein